MVDLFDCELKITLPEVFKHLNLTPVPNVSSLMEEDSKWRVLKDIDSGLWGNFRGVIQIHVFLAPSVASLYGLRKN